MSSPRSFQESPVVPHGHRLALAKSSPVAQQIHSVPAPHDAEEEMWIVDDRVRVRPAQMVEDKLSHVMQGSVVGVSHLRLKSLLAQRNRA